MFLLNRYPVKVLIFEPRASGGCAVTMDKAGVFKRPAGVGWQYKLKKRKDWIDQQRYENFFIPGGKGRLLILWSPSKGVYEPMTIEGFKLKADEVGWKENFMNNVQQSYLIFYKKSFLEKYMPLVALIVFGFIMIMTLVVIRQDLFAIIDTVRESVSGIGQSGPPPLQLG